jgi:hypothetical protein
MDFKLYPRLGWGLALSVLFATPFVHAETTMASRKHWESPTISESSTPKPTAKAETQHPLNASCPFKGRETMLSSLADGLYRKALNNKVDLSPEALIDTVIKYDITRDEYFRLIKYYDDFCRAANRTDLVDGANDPDRRKKDGTIEPRRTSFTGKFGRALFSEDPIEFERLKHLPEFDAQWKARLAAIKSQYANESLPPIVFTGKTRSSSGNPNAPLQPGFDDPEQVLAAVAAAKDMIFERMRNFNLNDAELEALATDKVMKDCVWTKELLQNQYRGFRPENLGVASLDRYYDRVQKQAIAFNQPINELTELQPAVGKFRNTVRHSGGKAATLAALVKEMAGNDPNSDWLRLSRSEAARKMIVENNLSMDEWIALVDGFEKESKRKYRKPELLAELKPKTYNDYQILRLDEKAKPFWEKRNATLRDKLEATYKGEHDQLVGSGLKPYYPLDRACLVDAAMRSGAIQGNDPALKTDNQSPTRYLSPSEGESLIANVDQHKILPDIAEGIVGPSAYYHKLRAESNAQQRRNYAAEEKRKGDEIYRQTLLAHKLAQEAKLADARKAEAAKTSKTPARNPVADAKRAVEAAKAETGRAAAKREIPDRRRLEPRKKTEAPVVVDPKIADGRDAQQGRELTRFLGTVTTPSFKLVQENSLIARDTQVRADVYRLKTEMADISRLKGADRENALRVLAADAMKVANNMVEAEMTQWPRSKRGVILERLSSRLLAESVKFDPDGRRTNLGLNDSLTVDELNVINAIKHGIDVQIDTTRNRKYPDQSYTRTASRARFWNSFDGYLRRTPGYEKPENELLAGR